MHLRVVTDTEPRADWEESYGLVYGYPLTVDVIAGLLKDNSGFQTAAKLRGAAWAAEEYCWMVQNLLYETNAWTERANIQIHQKEVSSAPFPYVLGIMYGKEEMENVTNLHLGQFEESLTPDGLWNLLVGDRFRETACSDYDLLKGSTTGIINKLVRAVYGDIVPAEVVLHHDGYTPDNLWREIMHDLPLADLLALVDLKELLDVMYTYSGIKEPLPDIIATFVV